MLSVICILFVNVQMKGCQNYEIPPMVAEMAKEIGLESKRDALSRTLSGGQKRKLSIGIALIGGSKVVASLN